jgi:transketolase
MVAVAVGLQVRGWGPFASTFAAFLTRAYDFIRMAAVSRADICLVGSHIGVSIGEDGPSQMGLEDLAMLRAVHGSTVLCPCDANQTVQLVEQMVDLRGIRYLRTMRPSTSVIYGPGRAVRGRRQPCRPSLGRGPGDACWSGHHRARGHRAAETLAGEGIAARVVDCYAVKPIDAETPRAAARATGRIAVAEDHWPQGGLGDAVLGVFADSEKSPRILRLAVGEMPSSGTPEELLASAGIDATGIAEAARRLVGTLDARG